MVQDNIYIQDNFFEKKFFKRLQEEVLTLEFKSRYKDLSGEAFNNIYQRNYHHVYLSEDAPVVLEVIKNIKKHFNYSFKKINANYLLSFPNTPAIPHEDEVDFNCLIYLIGDKLINNGTGFYEKNNEECSLHTHIGFKENRSVFFDAKIWHSPLQFAGDSTPRYIMANGLSDYQ